VEHYQPELPFNTAITRAFASLSDIVKLTAHLLGKDGVLLAMKGQNPEAELTQVTAKTTLIPVNVPGIGAERCLVRISTHG
jgi:16S rRNA (guanine527-N7)-methyltransferase